MSITLRIEPPYRQAMQDAGLADFDSVMRAPAGAAISRHGHRETVTLEISVAGAPRRFFLKRVFKVPAAHALTPWLRLKPGRSQPEREWEILGQLREAEISAMGRVALGEERRLGRPVRAFLLVEEAPISHTVEDWLVPGFPKPRILDARRQRRLLYDLGRQMARLHAVGFGWPDMSAKHIFAEPSAEGASRAIWRFCLIDVERMRRSQSPDRLDDLLRLRSSLRPFACTKRSVACFAAGYRSVARADSSSPPFAFKRLPDVPLNRFIDRDMPPRLQDDFEHPRSLRLARFDRVLADHREAGTLAQRNLLTLDGVFASLNGQALTKPGLAAHRDRIRVVLAEGRGPSAARVCYVKRYRAPPLADQLRRMREFHPARSSALREVHFIRRLSQHGIPTLRAIAAGDEMAGPWERRSFAITDEIRGESLEKLAERASQDRGAVPAWSVRREIIRQLALVVRRLHANRLFHRDLYLSHVFLTQNADGGIVLRLIDLARMIERPARPRRWAVKDLAALDHSAPAPLVTRTDRLRFMYHYLADSAGHVDRRTLAGRLRAIGRRSRRMAGHDAKRLVRLREKSAK